MCFVGYSLNYHDYRCLDPAIGCIFLSRHVVFDESQFPFATSAPLNSINNHTQTSHTSSVVIGPLHVPHGSSPSHVHASSPVPTTSNSPPNPPNTSHSPRTNSTPNNLPTTLHSPSLQHIASTAHDPSDTTTSNISLSLSTQPFVPPNNINASSTQPSTHPMITRSPDGTRYKRVLLFTLYPMPAAHATSTTPREPTCHTQASKLPA
ncbi:hypothetical protein AMTRI_Chr09g18920 [Amborella trichopoda]|uniref:Retroviral polymerase SH3-like domain-containing protein n=1 Tax=Amborella trichopoda TaxID=13333 RepID=U5D6Y1_AMBTC|nr:hypothetical protein AMTR_s00055p00022090 [Amborella trichopoda]